ncbi:sphingomyelin phosphodiesterase 4 isoform X2 [Frankliniella occidentalis]|uniref:Sphingomyelin phosphodiesterase 4 isoform X2 n=1 Tax=Frankliniella occidentalis TaxID=133901 RepID=A0A6J1TIQ0_FRAOC|nr:sphingomyelin phosphodiesterase 4 isoform X2 [Frankliniella occidentalis]
MHCPSCFSLQSSFARCVLFFPYPSFSRTPSQWFRSLLYRWLSSRRFLPLPSRLQLALQNPLQYRCEEITRIIDELGTKELQNALPLLLADLFGVSSQSLSNANTTSSGGWGLRIRTVMQSNEFTDYNVLYQFLHPQGPLFRLLYKLLQDCHLKYEFPLQWLPARIKHLILRGMVPPFYLDKLQLDPQTKTPTSLALNSFELYIFHFAYHLVNPELQRVHMNAWLYSDSLYLNLTEAYLSELLPCDRSTVLPAVPFNFGVMQSYSASFGPYGTLQRIPNLHSTSRSAHTPHLLRQSVIQQGSSSGSLHSSPATAVTSTRTEIWRSETVAQVFVDFWLSHGEGEIGPVFGASGSPQRELLPTGEHIRVVRNLIKHLHYFSNSVTGDQSAMDELRRIIGPSSQAKIYGFLRRTIHHWPLDSSFRFILETWLSYIQPWRYTDHRYQSNLPAGRSSGMDLGDPDLRNGRNAGQERKEVDRRWISFIAENLLSYTVIFQEMIPRFARLDLSTPKNANMLFRVSKVFSQPNLAELIQEVESCLDDLLGSVSPQKRSAMSSDHPLGGLAAHQATKWSAIVRQQIQDLESPGFQYKPMFGSAVRSQVVGLMIIVQQAHAAAISTQRALEEEATLRSHSRSFLSVIKDMLLLSDHSSNDEYSPEERLKVLTFLNTAISQFSDIFKINNTEIMNSNNMSISNPDIQSNGDVTDYGTPTTSRTITYRGQQSQMNMTPLAGEALTSTPQQWRQRSMNLQYEGDPDLIPIRSDESEFLVRLLYQVASKLNEMYCSEMARLYHREDVWGRVARQILSAPMTVYRYDKRSPGSFSPRVGSALPPRLSLRPLARYRNLAMIAMLYIVALVCNAPPYAVLCSAILFWGVLVTVKAVIEPWGSTRPSQPRFSDRLNDSLADQSF